MSETHTNLHYFTNYYFWCAPFTVIAAVLLFMMQYMLLHHNTTFEVLAAKQHWNVEEKAECCRNAGLFYLSVTLLLWFIKFVEQYRVLRWLQRLLYKGWAVCCPWRWRYFKLREEEDNDESRSRARRHKIFNHDVAYHRVRKSQSSCHTRNRYNNKEQERKETSKVLHTSRPWRKEVHNTWTNVDESDLCLLAHRNNKKSNHMSLFAERRNQEYRNNINEANSNIICEITSDSSWGDSSADRESEQEMISTHVYQPYDKEITFDRVYNTSIVNHTADNIVANSSDDSSTTQNAEEVEDEAQSEGMATLPYFLHNARDVKCRANSIIIEKQRNLRLNNAPNFQQNAQSNKIAALHKADISTVSSYDRNSHANIDNISHSIANNSISNSNNLNYANIDDISGNYIHQSNKLEQIQQQQASMQLSSLNPLALTPFELRSSTHTHPNKHSPISVNYSQKNNEQLINRRWRRGEWMEENINVQSHCDKIQNSSNNDRQKVKNDKRTMMESSLLLKSSR